MEYDGQAETPPGYMGDHEKYAFNTIANDYKFFTNGAVETVRPYFGFFRTEPGWDIFRVIGSNGTFNYSDDKNLSELTTVMSSDVWNPSAATGAGLGSSHFWLKWTSDYAIAGFKPPRFAGLDVKCFAGATTSVANATSLVPNTRSDGLLIGTGDTIHLTVQQPANRPMSIVLDALAATSGSDFDIYVSTSDTTPDGSSYNWRGFTSSTSESIRIPSVSTARNLYIAVNSYSGAGHFTLHPLVHAYTADLKVCRVGFPTAPPNPGPTSTDLAYMRTHLRLAAARMTTVSNGNFGVNNFTDGGNTATCGSSCNICMYDGVGPGLSASLPTTIGCSVAHIPRANWELASGVGDAGYTAHELVHSCLGIRDEYVMPPAWPHTPSYCGHTIVSNADENHGLCSIAHCDRDDDSITSLAQYGTADETRSCSFGSGWEQLYNRYSPVTGLQGPAYWLNTSTAEPFLYGSNAQYTSQFPVAFLYGDHMTPTHALNRTSACTRAVIGMTCLAMASIGTGCTSERIAPSRDVVEPSTSSGAAAAATDDGIKDRPPSVPLDPRVGATGQHVPTLSLTDSVLRGQTAAPTSVISFAIRSTWFGASLQPFAEALQTSCIYLSSGGGTVGSAVAADGWIPDPGTIGRLRVAPVAVLGGDATWTLQCTLEPTVARFGAIAEDVSAGSTAGDFRLSFSVASAPTIRKAETHTPKGGDARRLTVELSEPLAGGFLAQATLSSRGSTLDACPESDGKCMTPGEQKAFSAVTFSLPPDTAYETLAFHIPAASSGPGGATVASALGGTGGAFPTNASMDGGDAVFPLEAAGWHESGRGQQAWTPPAALK